MQEAWENMAKHDRFERVHAAIDAGLENLQKWYRKVDDTDAYFISLGSSSFVHLDWYWLISQVLDPNIKLAYAEAKWDSEYYEMGLRRLEAVVCSSAGFLQWLELLTNATVW